MSDENKTLGPCILELMGHRRLAGFVSEETIAGAAFLRIDIPCEPPVTQFYSGQAVYAITPSTEEIVRGLAPSCRPAPVSRYELLPAPDPNRGEDEDDEYDPDHRPF